MTRRTLGRGGGRGGDAGRLTRCFDGRDHCRDSIDRRGLGRGLRSGNLTHVGLLGRCGRWECVCERGIR